MPSRFHARLKKVEQGYDLSSAEMKLLLKFPPEMRSLVREIPPEELLELADRLRKTALPRKKNRKKER